MGGLPPTTPPPLLGVSPSLPPPLPLPLGGTHTQVHPPSNPPLRHPPSWGAGGGDWSRHQLWDPGKLKKVGS